MSDAFQRMVDGRPRARRVTEAALTHFTGRVIKWDTTGAYVAPVFDELTPVSVDNPIGPCRGGTYRDVGSCSDAAHTHPLLRVPVGTLVCVTTTAAGPWIVAVDGY